MTAVSAPARQGPGRTGGRRRWTRHVLPVYSWLIIAYLVFPIAVMVLYSFNKVTTGLPQVSFAWNGFTLQWYRQWSNVPGLTSSFWLSIRLALYIWRRLLLQYAERAILRAFRSVGSRREARIAMTAMTTRSSISVKAFLHAVPSDISPPSPKRTRAAAGLEGSPRHQRVHYDRYGHRDRKLQTFWCL